MFRLAIQKGSYAMQTFFPTKKDGDQHACQEEEANNEYYKVILFHYVYTIY